jgi:hypothetical protein
MKVFTATLSMFGAKVQIALREKGLAFDCVMVPFDRDDRCRPKHPEVLAAMMRFLASHDRPVPPQLQALVGL